MANRHPLTVATIALFGVAAWLGRVLLDFAKNPKKYLRRLGYAAGLMIALALLLPFVAPAHAEEYYMLAPQSACLWNGFSGPCAETAKEEMRPCHGQFFQKETLRVKTFHVFIWGPSVDTGTQTFPFVVTEKVRQRFSAEPDGGIFAFACPQANEAMASCTEAHGCAISVPVSAYRDLLAVADATEAP